MQRPTKRIMEQAERMPVGAPIVAKGLLHLGSRAAVDQATSRLAKRGGLMRAGRGLYLRPIESRFGIGAPAEEKVVEAVAAHKGGTMVPNGVAAANALGLTTQVPVRSVYLTSGTSRKLCLGRQVVEFTHAPRSQLALPNRPAGAAVQALAWLGPAKAGEALRALRRCSARPIWWNWHRPRPRSRRG